MRRQIFAMERAVKTTTREPPYRARYALHYLEKFGLNDVAQIRNQHTTMKKEITTNLEKEKHDAQAWCFTIWSLKRATCIRGARKL